MPPKESKRAAPASKAPALTDPDRETGADQLGVTTPAAFTEDDRELLALAAEVEKCVQSARNLVLRADTQAHVARFGSVEAAKLRELKRMRRMLLAWRDLRDAGGAPFVDARMLLTEGILFYGAVLRSFTEQARQGSPVFTPEGRMRTRPGVVVTVAYPAPGETKQRQYAALVATLVAGHFPGLAARMSEPNRVERIRSAIASAATSTKRTPWKLIARTWDGIEAKPQDEGTWRSAWSKHKGGKRT